MENRHPYAPLWAPNAARARKETYPGVKKNDPARYLLTLATLPHTFHGIQRHISHLSPSQPCQEERYAPSHPNRGAKSPLARKTSRQYPSCQYPPCQYPSRQYPPRRQPQGGAGVDTRSRAGART